MPEKAEEILKDVTNIQKLAARFFSQEDMFFIGRGLDNALCMEASLKLKEISYIHSEAMAAGELKHGTIALIEPGRLVVAMCTQTATMDKLYSNIREVLTRGAVVLTIGYEDSEREKEKNQSHDADICSIDSGMSVWCTHALRCAVWLCERHCICKWDILRSW